MCSYYNLHIIVCVYVCVYLLNRPYVTNLRSIRITDTELSISPSLQRTSLKCLSIRPSHQDCLLQSYMCQLLSPFLEGDGRKGSRDIKMSGVRTWWHVRVERECEEGGCEEGEVGGG